jgi:hypothetical protein
MCLRQFIEGRGGVADQASLDSLDRAMPRLEVD